MLLSWFRAAPGIFAFSKIAQCEDLNHPPKQFIWTAAFMVFKVCLSFLAIFSKSSYFKAWDDTWAGVCLMFTLTAAGVELVLVSLILAGLRSAAKAGERKEETMGESNGNSSSSLYEPLVGRESKDIEAGGGGGGGDGTPSSSSRGGSPSSSSSIKAAKRGSSIYRLMALSKPERPLILIGTIALFLSSASSMALPYFIGVIIDSVSGGDDDAATAKRNLAHGTLVLLGILLVGSIFTFIRGTLFNWAGERLVGKRDRGSREEGHEGLSELV